MRNFLITGFLLIGQFILAQSPLSEAGQIAFKIKVAETAAATTTIVAEFTQTKEMEFLSEAAAASGMLTFKAPNKIRWEYTEPYPMTVIFKDNFLLLNDGGKKSDFDLGANKLFKSFNTLILGSINGDLFDSEAFEMSFLKHKEQVLVRFIPKNKRMRNFIDTFEIYFDEESAEVRRVDMIESSGDRSRIDFKNRKTNVPVEDALFSM